MKYALPECLAGRTTQLQYDRWLQRKAAAHVRHDGGGATVARYKEAIHAAVCANGDRDYYTGEPLDWSIINKWRNADSTAGKKKYKRQFAQLPTVDHTSTSRAA